LNKRVKFASQADASVLAELRALAEADGRQLQALIDEALRDYLEKRKSGRARPKVMEALRDSMREHDVLYRELAK
jgi:hypothetical protein